MGTILHFGETTIDFLEVGDLWPEELGGSFLEHSGAQACVANALRAGTLLMMREEETQTLVAAAAIDLLTYAPNMFVPFVIVRPGLPNELSTRRQINSYILRLAFLRKVPRLMFHITKNDAYNTMMAELNDTLSQSGSRIKVDVSGAIEDLYGDGRTISTVSLFIQPDERPELMGNVVRESTEFYRQVIKFGKKEAIALIVGASPSGSGSGTTAMARAGGGAGGGAGGFGGVQAACCSGCNEDNKNDKTGGKDKESSKDGKDSKDGADKGSGKDGVERNSKLTPEKGTVDALGVLSDYTTLGIQQFDRTNREFPFLPLA